MTAYNILSYVKMENLPQALSSVKWLAKQRNSQGGFVSTQDTVVALEALSEYMKSVTRTDVNMNIDMAADTEKLESVRLNDDNALLLQSQKLTQLPTSLAHGGYLIAPDYPQRIQGVRLRAAIFSRGGAQDSP